MFFVVDKPRLQRIISIVRDDRSKESQGPTGPYMRLEAADGRLKLSGHSVEAEFPATVHEPGVLFLRITLFRRMLKTVVGQKQLAIQVNHEGVFFDTVRFPLENNDMLLFADPNLAPKRHPAETDESAPVIDQAVGSLNRVIESCIALRDRLIASRQLKPERQRIEIQCVAGELPDVAREIEEGQGLLKSPDEGTLF